MRSATFIAVAAGLALLILGGVGVYAYDAAREDTIAEGVTVGGVDVGGLQRGAAERRLRSELVDPLSAPVVVRARSGRHTLTAKVARVRLDVGAMVDDALARSRGGTVFSRTWRGLTGGELDAEIEPDLRYSSRAVDRLVARVARHVDRAPRDARVRFTGEGIERVRHRTGMRLDRDDLREHVERALHNPVAADRVVVAKVRRTKPRTTVDELGRRYRTVLTINRGAFRLKLYKNLELVRAYPIAVGQVGLETPAGRYEIQNKAVNPAWSVPNSAWAGSLAGQVIPGGVPENPLKARWLGIYNGAGIHGTDARGSIGTNASHGCVRMLIEDVIELYDRVPVGTPVYIA